MKNNILIFFTKYGLIIGGLLIILIGTIILTNGYLDKAITEKNKSVTVNVIDCYNSGNNNYFLKFEFNNKTFIKRTKGLYCEKIEGKNEIEMLTNVENDRFIFSDEYKTDNDFVFGFLMSIIGFVIVYKGIKNKNLTN